MGRTLIVGDVQGCLAELEDLLAAAKLVRGTDELIFVGDLVAKGPDSRGVVELARGWPARAVRGNHEAHLLKFRREGRAELRAEHLAVAKSLSDADWRYLEGLPLWLRLPGMIVVHAGLVPGIPLERQEEQALLNIRSITRAGKWSRRVDAGEPWASKWMGPERVVFGHDAVRGLQQRPFATGLDTGCVYGKRLTGLLLPADELLWVPARRQWTPIEGS